MNAAMRRYPGWRFYAFCIIGVLFDGLFLGFPGVFCLGFVVASVWFVFRALLGGDRWRIHAIRGVGFALSAVLVVLLFNWNMSLARHRAHRIATAAQQYHARHGQFPDKLDDLVPEFLDAIPAPSMRLRSRYTYVKWNEEPMLFWRVLAIESESMSLRSDDSESNNPIQPSAGGSG